MLRTLATVFLGACGALALTGPSVAHADNSIVSSTPEDGAELTAQPTEIVTTFENPIGSSVAVIVCDNDPFTGTGDGRRQRRRQDGDHPAHGVARRVTAWCRSR